ncbi:MAG: hypothetical protein AB7O56_07305 [Bauldia sp.]
MASKVVVTALTYALLGPALGLGITLGVLSPAIRNLGPVQPGSFFELALSLYVIGLPPMLATGLFVAAAEQRGAGFVSLLLQSAALGFLLTGISGLIWGFLGSVSIAPSWRLIVAIAAIGGVAASAACVVLGFFTLLRRRMKGAA